MKCVVVEKPVRDVDGVLAMLRKSEPPFNVVTVGADPKKTYVYLHESEKRDPSPIVQEWVDIPELRVTAVGQNGVRIPTVQADGAEVHILLVEKVTPEGTRLSGDERIVVQGPAGVPIILDNSKLEDGEAVVRVGPSALIGNAPIRISDSANKMRPARIVVRFGPKHIPPPPPEEPVLEDAPTEVALQPEQAPPPAKKNGIMATLRRILGIG